MIMCCSGGGLGADLGTDVDDGMGCTDAGLGADVDDGKVSAGAGLGADLGADSGSGLGADLGADSDSGSGLGPDLGVDGGEWIGFLLAPLAGAEDLSLAVRPDVRMDSGGAISSNKNGKWGGRYLNHK